MRCRMLKGRLLKLVLLLGCCRLVDFHACDFKCGWRFYFTLQAWVLKSCVCASDLKLDLNFGNERGSGAGLSAEIMCVHQT